MRQALAFQSKNENNYFIHTFVRNRTHTLQYVFKFKTYQGHYSQTSNKENTHLDLMTNLIKTNVGNQLSAFIQVTANFKTNCVRPCSCLSYQITKGTRTALMGL